MCVELEAVRRGIQRRPGHPRQRAAWHVAAFAHSARPSTASACGSAADDVVEGNLNARVLQGIDDCVCAPHLNTIY